MVPMAPSSTRMRLAASCRSSASTGESFGVNSAMQVTRSAPSPRKGEGWAEGVRALVDGACSGSSPRHHPCFPTRRCPRSAGRDSPWLPGPRFLPCPVRSAPRAARHRAPRSREHLRKQNRPRSDRSAPAGETSNRRGGGRADGTTARVPRRSGRDAGVGLCRSCLSCPCPLTPTLSPLGRGSAPSSLLAPCAAPHGENAGKPTCSTSPRWGEVGARSAPGEGARAYRESLAPSPQPSPLRGEGARRVLRLLLQAPVGENAGSAACSTSPRWGEVGARSAPGEGARAYRESAAPSPQPSPLRGEGARRVCRLLLQAPVGGGAGRPPRPPSPGGGGAGAQGARGGGARAYRES